MCEDALHAVEGLLSGGSQVFLHGPGHRGEDGLSRLPRIHDLPRVFGGQGELIFVQTFDVSEGLFHCHNQPAGSRKSISMQSISEGFSWILERKSIKKTKHFTTYWIALLIHLTWGFFQYNIFIYSRGRRQNFQSHSLTAEWYTCQRWLVKKVTHQWNLSKTHSRLIPTIVMKTVNYQFTEIPIQGRWIPFSVQPTVRGAVSRSTTEAPTAVLVKCCSIRI